MELISKKELLAETGISYGQLYRWKREGLIPPEWFMKQASYTGQETFLPRDKAVRRVEAILSLKDGCSLEEMARLLDPAGRAVISEDDLPRVQELDRDLLRVLLLQEAGEYPILAVAFFVLLSRAMETAGVAASAFTKLVGDVPPHGADAVCAVFLAGGEVHAAFGAESMVFDGGVEVVYSGKIGEVVSELRIKYGALFGDRE